VATGPFGSNAFGYDPRGFRVRRDDSGGSQLFHLENEHLEAVYDATGELRAKYLRGSIIDEVVTGYLYDEAGKEQAYMFHHDPVTSVVALTGHTGSLEEASQYHPFGASRAGGALRFVLAGGARIPSVAVFPELNDVPVAADWEGAGKSEVRVVRTAPDQSGYRFPLGPNATSHVDFGVLAAHDPVVGDWDGNGSPNAGVTTRNGSGACPSCLVWFLDLHSGGVGEIDFTFGETGDTPIVGDWDGNGSTNVGFVRASGGTLAFHLNVDNQGTIWSVVAFGLAGDAPVVGDWDGDDGRARGGRLVRDRGGHGGGARRHVPHGGYS
jgi:hypothetical protein